MSTTDTEDQDDVGGVLAAGPIDDGVRSQVQAAEIPVTPLASSDGTRGVGDAPIDPAPTAALAIPEVTVEFETPGKKPRGRRSVDPNHGRDVTSMVALRAGAIRTLDRRADVKGIPVSDRLFAGQTFAQCKTDLERVQALAGMVLGVLSASPHRIPLSLPDAFFKNGTIKDYAAVALLGRWLILDDAPGLQTRRGKPMDRMRVLKLVTAIANDRLRASRLESENMGAAASAPKPMTNARIAAVIHHVTGEDIAPGEVKSLRKSAVLAIADFLDHCRGTMQRETLSPVLSDVLLALDGKAAAAPTPTVPPTLTGSLAASAVRPGNGFTIRAHYSDDDQAALYRPALGAVREGPSVHYRATGTSGRTPGTQIYTPDIALSEFRVEAVIDRLELTLDVAHWAHHRTVKSVIDKATGGSTFVKDLTENSRRLENAHEGGFAFANTPGRFNIIVQEPTPAKIAAMLEALDKRFGLIGKPVITLLELSVDVYVDQLRGPADRRREQMVTVLHRHHHHWIDPSMTLAAEDRRQVYDAGAKRLKRPLFEHKKGSTMLASLRDANNPEARGLILGQTPEAIILNASVYSIDRALGVEVALQHKVTDQRNKSSGSHIELLPRYRRARMEVILSGDTLHQTYGITHLEDLTGERLRKIKRDHLSLYLPVLSDDPVQFAVEAERFARSGVYALDLYQRARAKQAGHRTGMGKHGKLVGWTEMNNRTGEAIDRLAKTWEGFNAP